MKLRTSALVAIAAFAVVGTLGSAHSLAQNAYVTMGSDRVAVISTLNNSATTTIPLGQHGPWGVAVSPDGSKVYVTSPYPDNTVLVIATANNAVIATIPVGDYPIGVAVTPDGSNVYVANYGSNT